MALGGRGLLVFKMLFKWMGSMDTGVKILNPRYQVLKYPNSNIFVGYEGGIGLSWRLFPFCSFQRCRVFFSCKPSLQSGFHDLDAAVSWAFQSLKTPDNGNSVASALANGTCMAICDGSYQDELGTAA